MRLRVRRHSRARGQPASAHRGPAPGAEPAGPLGTAIEVNASWNTFTAGFTDQSALAEDDLSAATSVLASGFANSVPLAAGSWGGLTTTMHDVTSGTGPLPVGYHPELEVTYREQLTSNVQVIAGRVADAAIPPGVLGVAVTQQTAARYSLHPGSRLKLGSSGKLGIPRPDRSPGHRGRPRAQPGLDLLDRRSARHHTGPDP